MIIRGLQGRPGQFEEDVPPVKQPALEFKESVFTLDEREKALLGSTLTLSSLSLSREMDFSCRIHDAFLTLEGHAAGGTGAVSWEVSTRVKGTLISDFQ